MQETPNERFARAPRVGEAKLKSGVAAQSWRRMRSIGVGLAAGAMLCASVVQAAGPATAEISTTGLAVTDTTVKVGILHSLTGTMAISEQGSVEAEKLAIAQINAQGGVLGRKIEFVVEDGASDWPTFAEKARKLLVQDKVAAVFGAWTSASRKAVLPVFERQNGLLYYPTFYEGLEQSKNVIYTARKRPSRFSPVSTGWPRRRAPRLSIWSVPTHLAAHQHEDRAHPHREAPRR